MHLGQYIKWVFLMSIPQEGHVNFWSGGLGELSFGTHVHLLSHTHRPLFPEPPDHLPPEPDVPPWVFHQLPPPPVLKVLCLLLLLLLL